MDETGKRPAALRGPPYFCVGVLLWLSGCAVMPPLPAGEPCTTALFSVTDRFAGARRGTCRVNADDSVTLEIRPEDDPPINDSAWYAFRVDADTATTATIRLEYFGGHHRYVPKRSSNGFDWTAVDPDAVRAAANGRAATMELELPSGTTWISAQELVTPAVYDTWNRRLAKAAGIETAVLGESLAGLPIHLLDVNPGAKNVVILVGRQHPPEVSGAFAFYAFTETLFAGTALAERFRERFRIVAIPLLNPDGVVGGNWRHNLGGRDLNRDWGPFEQQETALVRDLLDAIDAEGQRVRAFIDFHSTKRNVFYTQSDAFPSDLPGFTKEWLAAAGARVSDYPFENDQNALSTQANAKNYMYRRYGIPSLTYEVGDETDRRATRAAAAVFAEEFMRRLLDAVGPK